MGSSNGGAVLVKRLLARVLAALLFVGGFSVAAGVRPASACSCVGYTDDEAFAAADVVFTARVVDVVRPTVMVSSTDETRFVFAIDRIFKGEAHRTQSVVTASDGASCGLEITGSGPFLVFARAEGDGIVDPDDGEFSSSLCSGTRPLASGAVPTTFGDGFATEAPMDGSVDSPVLSETSPIGRDESGLATLALVALAVVAAAGGCYLVVRTIRRHSASGER